MGYSRNDAYFETKKWVYGSIYGAINSSIEDGNGKNITKYVKEALDHDKDKSDIASSVTRQFKPIYLELLSQNKAADLHNKLITAYMAMGYTKDSAMKKIKDWSEPKKKK